MKATYLENKLQKSLFDDFFFFFDESEFFVFPHCALFSDLGELYTWGKGRYGRLGHGDSEDQTKPKLVEALLGYRVIDVACGTFIYFIKKNAEILHSVEIKYCSATLNFHTVLFDL